ncbi:MAG: choice-of-anchor D domain-containing protein [Bacteroidota bacterium]
MKTYNNFRVILLGAGLLLLGAIETAGQPVEPFTKITDDNFNKHDVVMDGDYIVYWRTNIANDNGIFLYHIPTGETTTVTSEIQGQYYNLDISGDRIVWQQSVDGKWDIYNYLISRPDLGAYPLIDFEGDQYSPAIHDDVMVYINHQADFEANVYMYNIATATLTQITTDEDLQQYNPDIYGNYIVWSDGRNGNQDIYMYDIYREEQVRITDNEEDQQNASIWKNRIVWEDHRNGNWDLYMHVINWFPDIDPVRFNQPIFTGHAIGHLNSWDQINPRIGDHYIVFQDNRSYNWDIYLYTFINPLVGTTKPLVEELRGQTEPVVQGQRVVWLDEREYTGTGLIFNNIWMWEKPYGVDLSLYIHADPDPAVTGAELTYLAIVTNLGDLSAIEPGFSFTLPTGVEFLSMDGFGPDGYSRAGDLITCKLDSVSAGTSDTVTIVVRPVVEGELIGEGTIASVEEDVDPDNDFYRCKTKVIWKYATLIGEGSSPAMAVDGAGHAHFCFLDGYYEGVLKYATLHHGVVQETVLDSSEWCWSPSIAVDKNHHIHMAYSRGDEMSPGQKTLCYLTNKSGVWSDPAVIADNVGEGGAVCIRVDGNDSIHVSCMTSPWAHGYLQYYIKSGSWSKVFSRHGSYNSSALDLDPDGHAHFSFYDLAAGGLRYVTNSPDGAFGPEESPDDDWHGGQMESLVTDIAVDRDGWPHISYVGSVQDWGNEDYKYAVKSVQGWSDHKIDDGDFAGADNSIDTDLNRNPHICFYNPLSERLNYAWKESDLWHTKVVDFFSPEVIGVRMQKLAMDRFGFTHIVFNKGGSVYYVTNTIPVPEPVISVTPQSIEFPDRLVGDTTDAVEVLIANVGEADLVISDIRIVWRDSASFSVAGDTCNVIHPGSTCPVNVRFNPTIIGQKQALLWIESNDPANPTEGVGLSGLGVDGILWDYGSLSFGGVALGDLVIHEYKLKNVGNTNLVVQGVYLQNGDTDDFYYTDLPEPSFSIADGDSVTFNLVFKPTAEGERSVMLRIFSTGGSLTREVTGTGMIPDYQIEGEVRLPDNNLVDQGWIWVINLDENSPHHQYHYKPLEGAESFTFTQLPEVNVTLRFDPDEATYPGYIRTYYGDKPFIEEAESFLLDHDVQNLLITLLEAPFPGTGSGEASGSLVEEGGKKAAMKVSEGVYEGDGVPLESVPVYLTSLTGQIEYADITGTDGAFSFGQISQSSYLFKSDYKGYPMSADNDTLKVTKENQQFDIVAVVSSGEIAVAVSELTGLDEAPELCLNVYPNPFSGKLIISIEGTVCDHLGYEILDMTGRILIRGDEACGETGRRIELNTEQLSNGSYILKLQTEEWGRQICIVRQ